MKKICIGLIRAYRRYASPDSGMLRKKRMPTCVFLPTCSEYAETAIEKYGVLKGGALTIKRILRCHPWQKEHFDPVK